MHRTVAAELCALYPCCHGLSVGLCANSLQVQVGLSRQAPPFWIFHSSAKTTCASSNRKGGPPFTPIFTRLCAILIGKQVKSSRVFFFLFNLWCSSITFPVFPCWLMEWTLILTCFHQAGFYNLDPSLFAHHYTCLSIFQHFHAAEPNPSWMLPSNKSSKQSESATSTRGGFFSVDSFGIN